MVQKICTSNITYWIFLIMNFYEVFISSYHFLWHGFVGFCLMVLWNFEIILWIRFNGRMRFWGQDIAFFSMWINLVVSVKSFKDVNRASRNHHKLEIINNEPRSRNPATTHHFHFMLPQSPYNFPTFLIWIFYCYPRKPETFLFVSLFHLKKMLRIYLKNLLHFTNFS